MAFTPISELGEFGLIDRITQKFTTQHENLVTKGIGDDAAVINLGAGEALVVASDLLAEGVHFDLSYVPLRHLGYKAVAINLSDIFAMNAVPFGITVSLSVSSRFTVEAIEELYEGIRLACEKWNVDLLGGDTTSAQQGLTISITALGQAKDKEIVYRSGAKPQDLVCVTGDVGAAYAGFLILDREKATYIEQPDTQPDLSDYDYVIGRQLKPEPRGDMIQKLRELGIQPHSMIDISDGISSDLAHICKASGVGTSVYLDKLPIDYQTVRVGEEFNIATGTFALHGGEDYELLFTIPLSDFEKISKIPEVHVIGKITDEVTQRDVILSDGTVSNMQNEGWDHFG